MRKKNCNSWDLHRINHIHFLLMLIWHSLPHMSANCPIPHNQHHTPCQTHHHVQGLIHQCTLRLTHHHLRYIPELAHLIPALIHFHMPIQHLLPHTSTNHLIPHNQHHIPHWTHHCIHCPVHQHTPKLAPPRLRHIPNPVYPNLTNPMITVQLTCTDCYNPFSLSFNLTFHSYSLSTYLER